MKSYTITVNGNVYDVTVEEKGSGTAPVASYAPVQAAQPVQQAALKAQASGAQGSVKITSPMPGKILGVSATVGQAVKKGEVIIVLEAMKMENEIVATADGTVASINVQVGSSVEAGDVLATLN